MGLPDLRWIFHCKLSIWGYHHLWKPVETLVYTGDIPPWYTMMGYIIIVGGKEPIPQQAERYVEAQNEQIPSH